MEYGYESWAPDRASLLQFIDQNAPIPLREAWLALVRTDRTTFERLDGVALVKGPNLTPRQHAAVVTRWLDEVPADASITNWVHARAFYFTVRSDGHISAILSLQSKYASPILLADTQPGVRA